MNLYVPGTLVKVAIPLVVAYPFPPQPGGHDWPGTGVPVELKAGVLAFVIYHWPEMELVYVCVADRLLWCRQTGRGEVDTQRGAGFGLGSDTIQTPLRRCNVH